MTRQENPARRSGRNDRNLLRSPSVEKTRKEESRTPRKKKGSFHHRPIDFFFATYPFALSCVHPPIVGCEISYKHFGIHTSHFTHHYLHLVLDLCWCVWILSILGSKVNVCEDRTQNYHCYHHRRRYHQELVRKFCQHVRWTS